MCVLCVSNAPTLKFTFHRSHLAFIVEAEEEEEDDESIADNNNNIWKAIQFISCCVSISASVSCYLNNGV